MLWSDEGGITSVEYALLLAMLAAGISIAAVGLGNTVGNQVNEAADCVATDDPATCS